MYYSVKENGLSLDEVLRITGGEAHNFPAETTYIYGVCTDTRKDAKNSLFAALVGENFDGHDFVQSAYDGGAVCALTEKAPDTDKPFIVVKNTLAAYGKIAAAYKDKFSVMTIAVTGSVGKTTTKEAICATLSAKYNVCKTHGNFNNEIGLPQTLLSLNASHKIAVLEMGMSERGEISALSKIARPDIAIITNIGFSHIEHLKTRENILRAKLEILSGMQPDGMLLINGDDDMLKTIKEPEQFCVRVGIDDPGCRFRATDITFFESGTAFDAVCGEDRIEGLFIPSVGKHAVYAAMFAVACGVICGLDESELRRGIAEYSPADMRQNIVRRDNYTKIEDCYNASPESMRASIDVMRFFADKRGGRAVAVLGEMKELGEKAPEIHESVGKYAAKYADGLFLFGDGENVRALAEGYEAAGKFPVMLGNEAEKAADIIKQNIKDGDVLLFKASRAVTLEKLSERF
ncbi:MAG: UDP-N-acetylmuramoyl-tripeptide--D-alanyl-D-alanine ligase [Clostridia bacterium]|nr:UDP-N-acetylmuramoyl-tripeptide--D-alanyl-D-alanine ligase [Clostridia bacterium]